MPDLSVIINTRDRPDQLRLCLGALEAQTLSPARWEIVVVDDASRDDSTALMAKSYAGRSACRLVTAAGTGRAAARNAGIAAAEGRWVLFLGDDIMADPDLLEQHLAAHERWPGAAILGSREEEFTPSSAVFREWWDNCRYQDIRDPHNATFEYFYTCNVSVERQALLDAGGFDENFLRYGWEDLDLGLRLQKRGVRLVYYPRAHATHHHPRVSLEALCAREKELGFSTVYYVAKWPDEPAVQKVRFWQGDASQVKVGPEWRRALGRMAIKLAEAICPISPLLRPIYLRLVMSCRLQGVREGATHYAPMLERLSDANAAFGKGAGVNEGARRFQR